MKVVLHEWRLIVRDRSIAGAAILILLLAAYAGFVGRTWRDAELSAEKQSRAQAEAAFASLREKADGTVAPSADFQPDAGSPRYVGSRPMPVFLPLQPLAALAIGQSDLMPRRIEASIMTTRRMLARNYEIQNPAHLLNGPFDLAFLVVFLLPLVVLVMAYGLVTGAREDGTLALAVSQPTSILRVLGFRIALRSFFAAALASVACLTAALTAGIDFAVPGAPLSMALFCLVSMAYCLFWLFLGILVSAISKTSAAAAVSLSALWLGLVVVVPVTLSTLVNELHPMPSRSLLAQESRAASTEASMGAKDLLQQLLHDHPELLPQDGSVNLDDFYNRNRAMEQSIARRIDPLLDRFDEQLARQQQAVRRFSVFSPAILVQESLVSVSGGSTERLQRFKAEAWAFVERWKAHFFPRIFRNERLRSADYDGFPVFRFADEAPRGQSAALLSLGAVDLLLMMLLAFRLDRLRIAEE